MKKFMAMFIALLLCFTMVEFAPADGLLEGDDFLDSLYLKGMGSWCNPTADGNFVGYDDGWYAGGGIGCELNEYFAIEFESGYYAFGATENILGIDIGGAGTVPLLVNAVIGYPITDLIYPYAIVGIGAGINTWNDAPDGINIDIDTSLIGKFGVGCDFNISERVALFVEGSYLLNEPDADVSVANMGTMSIKDQELNTWMVGGGVKFFF